MRANTPRQKALTSAIGAHLTVSELVVARAAETPDAPAIVTPDDRCTWSQLLQMAHGWAVVMSPSASGATQPVAVVVDGSLRSFALAVAVTMSGRALVPLDPGAPPARRTSLVEASGAMLVDTDLVPVDGDLPVTDPASSAFILFTSGSSGLPKGVVFSHLSALAKADVVARELQITSADRVASALPFGFGAGLTTFLAALMAGAPTFYWDSRFRSIDNLAEWIETNQVTTLHASASMLRGLAASVSRPESARDSIAGLRLAVAYGEALEGTDVIAVRRMLPTQTSIITWYATTEVGAISWREIKPEDGIGPGSLHVGAGVAGRELVLSDDNGDEPPVGTVGEVHIRGGCIPFEYLDGTPTRAFVDHNNTAVYRTGDRGRFDSAGNLHLTGRVDDLLKIRGYLIEPSEVSMHLRDIPGVLDAFTVATEGASRGLRSYIASTPHGQPLVEISNMPDDSSVRAHLRSRVPEWMVPQELIRLSTLPRTERGKVDRAALASSTRTLEPEQRKPPAARSLTETAVLEILTDVLGHDAQAPASDDDLMACGLDSLALTTVLAQVSAWFHVEISPQALLRTPTIRRLAELISEETRAGVSRRSADPILVPLQVTDSDQSVFVIAGAGAPAISLMALCRHLNSDRSVYGLQVSGLEGRARPDSSITAAAALFIKRMRCVQPRGPYTLIGHSMGGVIAQEMASQLEVAGECADRIIIVDSRLTESMLRDLPGAPVADPGPPPPASASETPRQPHFGLGALTKMWLQIRLAGWWQFDPVTQWMIFYNTGLRMLRRHTMKRCHSPLTVLRTPDNPQTAEMWVRVTTGSVDVIDVDGDHAILLREPSAQEIARHCRAALGDRTLTRL